MEEKLAFYEAMEGFITYLDSLLDDPADELRDGAVAMQESKDLSGEDARAIQYYLEDLRHILVGLQDIQLDFVEKLDQGVYYAGICYVDWQV